TLIGSTCERLDDALAAYVGGGSVGVAAAREYLGRIYIGMFDAHIANSMYTARELQAGMRPPHVRRVHVAPPGVDAVPEVSPIRRHAARVRLRARFGITLTAPLLVYAGRLAPEKNVTILPEIISRVRQRIAEAQLLVVGDGPSRDAVERAAKAAAGAVHLHPHISGRDALFAMLAAADLFVHPNGREPFGIGPLEAMAAGIPVVLPNSGGLTTYATEQNAWMARADASELASAAVAALVNDPERERRVEAGRRTARQFAWPVAASRMLALQREIHLDRTERDRFGRYRIFPVVHPSSLVVYDGNLCCESR
ncbi:MAG: glycosyltransferase family 4 protein, partial [Acidobacteriota bacterium]|nr:glycosyltransferase family 4 protein [Acidobacteriota bacterium]